eukprot:8142909-Alexandrium_andersonii.AAC.1
MRAATRREMRDKVMGDPSVIKNRTSKSSRQMVEVGPRLAKLVESRGDLEFVQTRQGYSHVRCKGPDHEMPVELHAALEFINGT